MATDKYGFNLILSTDKVDVTKIAENFRKTDELAATLQDVSLTVQYGAELMQYFHPKADSVANVKSALDLLFEDGGGGSTVIVDQEYNPTSANAQSGTAVAEAIRSGAENIDYSIPWYYTENLKASLDAMASDVLGIGSHALMDDKLDVLIIPEQPSPEYIPTSYAVRATINAALGDVETALDSIIAIQNELIGGAE